MLAYSLTTVARAKTFMGVVGGGDDTLIERLIDSATNWIENYCDRRFKQTAYTNELYDGTDGESLLTLNFPISTTATFKLEERAGNLSNSGFDTIDSSLYHIDYNAGLIKIVDGKFYEYPNHYRLTYTAGYNYDNAASFLSDVGAADLEFACWKLVSTIYHNRKLSGNVDSESIGDYSVTFSQTTFADKELMDIFDRYKRVVYR